MLEKYANLEVCKYKHYYLVLSLTTSKWFYPSYLPSYGDQRISCNANYITLLAYRRLVHIFSTKRLDNHNCLHIIRRCFV